MSGNDPAKISYIPGTSAYGQPRKRLVCWLLESNAHGLGYETHWLEEGDKPDIGEWIRAPWMDEPAREPEDRKAPEGWDETRTRLRADWERKMREHNITPSVTDAYTDGFYDGSAWAHEAEEAPRVPVTSCRDCPELSPQTLVCLHERGRRVPHGAAEDSWARRSEPPPQCPLRRAPVLAVIVPPKGTDG